MSGASQLAGTAKDRITDDLRRQIKSGALKPGDGIGTTQQLAGEYQVGRATIREAFAILTGEGLLVSGKGYGVRVRKQPERLTWDLGFERRSALAAAEDDDSPADGDWWDEMVRRQGRKPRQDVELSFLPGPPPEVAALLEWDAKTVVRSRVRYVDGTPAMLATSYFPFDVAEGTPLAEPGDVHARGGVLAAYGHPQAVIRWTSTARMPSAEEAAKLDMLRGVPVHEVTFTGYEEKNLEFPDGRPVRVMVTIAPADRWTLSGWTDVT